MDSLSSGSIKTMISSLQNYILNEISASCPENIRPDSVIDEIENISASHPWFIKEHLIYALKTFAEGLHLLDIGFLGNEKFLSGKKIGFWFRPLAPCEGLPHLLVAMLGGAVCEIITDRCNRRMLDYFIRMFENFPSVVKATYSFQESSFSNDISAIVVVGEKPSSLQIKYFSKYPVFLETAERFGKEMILSGIETQSELDEISLDLGMYFGRSIYNKSILIVPENYNFENLKVAFENFAHYSNHSRYFNHYEYRKAGFMVGSRTFIDTGVFLFTPGISSASYISVIQYYVDKIRNCDRNFINNGVFKSEPFGMRMFKSLPEFFNFITSLSN